MSTHPAVIAWIAQGVLLAALALMTYLTIRRRRYAKATARTRRVLAHSRREIVTAADRAPRDVQMMEDGTWVPAPPSVVAYLASRGASPNPTPVGDGPWEWTALAAPLGVADVHGRRLATTHRWALRGDSPRPLVHSTGVVGYVDEVRQESDALYLTGLVADVQVAGDIAAGRLFPALDLWASPGVGPTMVAGAWSEFGDGFGVAALTLVGRAPWPHQVWIRLDR
jgi:hypothetical protein